MATTAGDALRAFAPSDEAAARNVVTAAFGQADEADLVDALRADGDVVIEILAFAGEAAVGHVMLSRMTAPLPALALAPVSVIPAHQRQGVGQALVRAAVAAARAGPWQAIFVLGDLDYYGRFGFDAALAAPFDSPYAGPHFAALALKPWPASHGVLRHAPAFDALG
jgi:putative acetyltransferase